MRGLLHGKPLGFATVYWAEPLAAHSGVKAPINRTHSKRFARGRVSGPRVSPDSESGECVHLQRRFPKTRRVQRHNSPLRIVMWLA